MLTQSEKLRYSAHEHYAFGKYWEAIAESFMAITVSPANAWPYILLGKCYSKIGYKKQSLAMLKRGRQLIPTSMAGDLLAQIDALIADMERQ